MGVVNATTTLSLLMTVVKISPKETSPREGTARASSSDSSDTSQPQGSKGNNEKVMTISSEDESDVDDGKWLPELFPRAEDK